MIWEGLGQEILSKLFLAALLGGAIGFEREHHGQAAGFRTNILVAISACLLMLLSLYMEKLFAPLGGESSIRLDPSRMASYAVVGMGFLGAGTIIKGKGKVKGLTTAACLWLVNAIGLAVGAGYLGVAVLSTIISLIFLYVFRRVLRPTFVHDIYTVLTVVCKNMEHIEDIQTILSRYKVEIQAINCYHDLEKGLHTFKIRLRTTDHIPQRDLIEQISLLSGVKRLSWEEAPVP